MLRVYYNRFFAFIDGALEVAKGTEVLGKPMKPGTLFGELAILYNCTRTASVKGMYSIFSSF